MPAKPERREPHNIPVRFYAVPPLSLEIAVLRGEVEELRWEVRKLRRRRRRPR